MSDDCRVLALWIVQPTHKPDCKHVANSQIAHSVIHYPTGTTVLCLHASRIFEFMLFRIQLCVTVRSNVCM